MMTPFLFITCAPGLESLLQKELVSLDMTDLRIGYRGVYAPVSMTNIFKANYLSRLATRVLLPLAHFACPHPEALYREAKKIPWLDYLNETHTFSIDANIQHPQIRHSLYGAQLVKDAICDVIREQKGERPSIDTKNPDIQLNLFIQKGKAILSFDTSGAPLYKRGWRAEAHEASLPETLAAAILTHAQYNPQEVLCDPFCGSGTFLIEAACQATQTPAGYFRKEWGFMRLPSFKEEEWLAFKNSYDAKREPLRPGMLIGADSDKKSILACKEHLIHTGFSDSVTLCHTPVRAFTPPVSPTLVICNPPFGKRLEAPPSLYQDLGHFLQTRCPAAPWAYLLTTSFHFVKATKRPVLSEWPLQHGGLHVCLYQIQN